jgi:flagellar biosynthesis protein FlhA
MSALWIPGDRAERARRAGYTVVDCVSVLGTHLVELVRRHAHELLSRQDAKRLLDRVAVDHPRVVEDLVPKLLPMALVQREACCGNACRFATRSPFWRRWGKPLRPRATRRCSPSTCAKAIRRVAIRPYLNRAGELPSGVRVQSLGSL